MNAKEGNNLERAVLAGGCFWGMQDLIRKMDGVVSTRVGYTGGDVPNATYGTTARTPRRSRSCSTRPHQLPQLLEFFFQIHDPTTKNRQGNDVGTSYRSAIYTTSDEQRRSPTTRSPTSKPRACGRARW
jgi:peptide-methionine (S)-S-oxide reductase